MCFWKVRNKILGRKATLHEGNLLDRHIRWNTNLAGLGFGDELMPFMGLIKYLYRLIDHCAKLKSPFCDVLKGTAFS